MTRASGATGDAGRHHPVLATADIDYHPVVFADAVTGARFLTRSTATSKQTVTWTDGNEYPLITVEVTSDSHPFWTGTARRTDTAGRVERFERRYGKRSR